MLSNVLQLIKIWYIIWSRNRTSSQIIGYGLYLYFLGLSFRNIAKALSFLKIVKISHVSIWNWIQKYKPKKSSNETIIKEYIIDETALKVGSELIWLWVVIEPKHKEILSFQFKRTKHVCCWPISFYSYREVWNTFSFFRWWYMVSSSMQILEATSSSSLFFRKKHNWKDNAI